MLEKLTAHHSFGVSISADQIYFAHMGYENGKCRILSLSSATLEKVEEEEKIDEEEAEIEFYEESSEFQEVKPLYIVTEGEIPRIAKHWLIVSGCDTNSILSRTFEVGLTKPKDIEAVLSFQAEPLLPYPLEEAIIDHIPISSSESGTLINLLSIRKDHLKTHLRSLKGLGLEPEVTSCDPSALATFSKHYCGSEDPTRPIFILHIDLEETTRVLAADGKLLAAHSFSIGLKNLVWALLQDESMSPEQGYGKLSSFDFSTLDPNTHPNLHRELNRLKNEIARTLYALAKENKAQQVEEVIITGEGGALPNLVQALTSSLNIKITPPEPTEEHSTEILQKFAIPIGFALECMPFATHQVNFRQNDCSYPNPWKRFKQPIIVYLLLCLGVAFSFYMLGEAWIEYKTTSLKKKYSEVLASLELPYTRFETSFLEKIGHQEIDQDNLPPLSDLSQSDLTSRILFLQEKIRTVPESYPLHANIPRVSDLLAWLATHPALRGDGPSPLLNINSLNYTVIKRPKKGKNRDRYQAKVELEFSTPIPKNARSFRDALTAPNPMIDPKNEIKWTSTRDIYKTTFFLKDRTMYP